MTTQPPDWPEFTGPELCRLQAHELVALLKKGEVSPRDCLDAAFARIEAVEPTINAMPTEYRKVPPGSSLLSRVIKEDSRGVDRHWLGGRDRGKKCR